MKIYKIILIIFVAQTYSFGCDCGQRSFSEKYFFSEVVFLAIIGKDHAKENDIFSQKLSLVKLEIFKGIPYDTLSTGGLCSARFSEGDTVLLFGNNNPKLGIVSTSMCAGNRVIGPLRQIKQSRIIAKNLARLEIEALRFYKKNITEDIIRKDKIPIMLNRPNSIHDNPFRMGVERIQKIEAQADVLHLKITLDSTGNVVKVKTLNKTPFKVKSKVKKYLKGCKWKMPANPDSTKIETIESFIYPKEAIVFLDF